MTRCHCPVPHANNRHLQLNDTGKGKVCFVEFLDVPSAAYVHEILQVRVVLG